MPRPLGYEVQNAKRIICFYKSNVWLTHSKSDFIERDVLGQGYSYSTGLPRKSVSLRHIRTLAYGMDEMQAKVNLPKNPC